MMGEGRKDHNTYLNEYTAVLWATYTTVLYFGAGYTASTGACSFGHKRINT